LAHQGAGLLGDKLYDPEERVFFEMKESKPRNHGDKAPGFMSLSTELMRRLVLEAHALHAKRLKIRHPRTGKPLILEAPLPKEWQGLYSPPKGSF
jgi:23S rRNA-/tRNA-specific pseudouridylate synthase